MTLLQTADIRLSSVDEMMAHAGALFVAHWNEIATRKDLMRLAPDELRYRALEQRGALLTLAAWQGEELVGYSVTVVAPHLHYRELVVANNDLLFVREDARRSGVGLRLIRRTVDESKRLGAALMLWHAKPQTALATLLERLGYGVQDIIYGKEC